MDANDFKAFFADKIKPLLDKKHQLKDGPEVRFHWQPDDKEWELRYRFKQKRDGIDVKDDAGKQVYDNFHHQVQAIARGLADQAGSLLNQKLGITKSATIDF